MKRGGIRGLGVVKWGGGEVGEGVEGEGYEWIKDEVGMEEESVGEEG